jgi:MoxR-like ATPase
MLRTHIVLEAVRMCDECNAHAISILAHRVQSSHASWGESRSENVLLKAEFTPRAGASLPINRVIAAASQIILGKEPQLRLALACVLARGHLLIEDLPGVGKTTLAHVLARSLGLHFQRIQFTSDMLPADILGVAVYERDSGSFKFHPGPIFSQVILADEVNRSTPKTQSALLEAMEEHQVTAEGETRKLPEPFFVIATQNPSEQVGTFPLPESQLDRFMMRIELGYPDRDAERALLSGTDRRDLLATLDPCMSPAELMELQAAVQRIYVAPALLDYVQAIVEHTRRSPDYVAGLSPRAALALVHSARAWAMLEGRDKVIPEDVQAIVPGVAAHRLRPAHDMQRRVDVGAQLLAAVPIP